jgi:type I restriction enzyme R subunit
MSIVNEKAFEEVIEQSLLAHGGYVKGDPENFVRTLAIDKDILFDFLKASQNESWEALTAIHGVEVEKKFLFRLNQELDTRGMLDCLRHGITDYGKKFSLAYFKPVSKLNPETQKLYDENILTVTRQVHYSTKDESSVDMLLSVNGLPVASIELKNPFTGQDVDDAKRQYKYDRDEHELLFQFKKRALVHFAVDTDEVYMTTRIQGSKTKYLPFNLGFNKGAGNPPNPSGHKTAYLWEEVLVKDSLMDILGRFLHLEVVEKIFEGRTIKIETMIFPRYHQLDVVRKLTDDALKSKSGKNYLIQHSAGSGKSNSIAWLAYHLAGLHDKNDNRVFDSVIVVTDRLVLDQQLQDTIYQFEHKQGVVEKIDKDSTQLAQSLTSGTNIIITTLQKFPFVLDKVSDLPKRTYAVIVDEAHSSQGGESAKKMKDVLSSVEDKQVSSDKPQDDDDDIEDEIRQSMLKRGPQPNLSFFAFTATPKAKTLEVFGWKGPDGKPQPFHLYSMRQAIEEKFIYDVLENYITYKTFFQLSKKIEDDPDVNKKKAACAIARFLALHPHNLAQKTEVMIEHFRQVTMKKIGGKAKAMVVTASREHVVRYKHEFDRYLKEKGYKDIKALVAFSGKVLLDGVPPEYSEESMNKYIDKDGKERYIREKELPEKFATSEYQILLVAEKYQTGYDEPLLHTMYVDKRLDGVKAVQTLSRLNRTCPGKEDTFVLDFVNKREDILAAFQPYYEQTQLTETTDPNKLYDLKNKLDSFQIIRETDIDAFCAVFFKNKELFTKREHAQLNSIIDVAVARFKTIEKNEHKEDFANTLGVFVRLYAFLAQIMPFQDITLEKFYAYSRLLLKKLPGSDRERYHLGDEVSLEYYRLQKMAEGKIALQKDSGAAINPMSEAGTKKEKDEYARLSEIIKLLNDRFGTDFTEADKLFFDQIEEEMVMDVKLGVQAKTNTIDNFKYGFEDVFIAKLVDRMDQNQDIFNKIMDDTAFAAVVKDYLLKKVYTRLNEPDSEKQGTLFLSDVIGDDQIDDKEKFVKYLPVYSLEAVATNFGKEEHVGVIGWKMMEGKKLKKDMFIAQVVGKSMEPTIPDGSFCLFRFERGGSRNGLVVLVESRLVSDPENLKRFTVKRYKSEKEQFPDGQWRHKKITLFPDNKDFKDIILEDVEEDSFRVLAEFVEVLE